MFPKMPEMPLNYFELYVIIQVWLKQLSSDSKIQFQAVNILFFGGRNVFPMADKTIGHSSRH
jgi:hypothetical protein